MSTDQATTAKLARCLVSLDVLAILLSQDRGTTFKDAREGRFGPLTPDPGCTVRNRRADLVEVGERCGFHWTAEQVRDVQSLFDQMRALNTLKIKMRRLERLSKRKGAR